MFQSALALKDGEEDLSEYWHKIGEAYGKEGYEVKPWYARARHYWLMMKIAMHG